MNCKIKCVQFAKRNILHKNRNYKGNVNISELGTIEELDQEGVIIYLTANP